jgi:hypothetical protein
MSRYIILGFNLQYTEVVLNASSILASCSISNSEAPCQYANLGDNVIVIYNFNDSIKQVTGVEVKSFMRVPWGVKGTVQQPRDYW